MANFNININAAIVAPYQTAYTSFSKGNNCSGFLNSYDTNIAGSSSSNEIGLLAPWQLPTAGLTLAKMYIKNIQYTDSNSLWYEYNGTKLLPATEYEIDITGLVYTNVIPLLLIQEAQIPLSDTTQIISCDIALEDDTLTKYSYRNNKVSIFYDECN